MRRLGIALLVILLPLAQAGTESAPEVDDDSGDGFAGDPESARDLVAGWVEEVPDDSLFRFHAKLAGDPTHVFASLNAGSEAIRFGFTPSGLDLADGQESYVRIRFGASTDTASAGDEIATCRYGEAAEDEYESILTQVDLTAGFSGAHFWCDVPYDRIGHDPAVGSTFSDLHMDAHFIQRGPLSGDLCIVACAPGSGGDLGGVNEVQHYDRAPDDGYGTDFVVPAAAPDVVFQGIEEFPFLNETTDPTSGVFQYNWTSEESFRFLGEVSNGTLGVNVTAGGEQVFVWNGTDGFDHRMDLEHACVDEAVTPVPCEYTAVYTLTDFTGIYGIDIAVEETMGETNATDDPDHGDHMDGNGNATGNETTDDASDDKESPGVALPIMMALIAAIAIGRRRA